MDQEAMLKAALFERQSQEIQEKLELVTRQIYELEQFKKNLKDFSESKEKEMLSSVGIGIYVKTSLEEKDLFVDVGAGVIVRKTPEETVKVIEDQISKLNEARIALTAQMDSFNAELQNLLEKIEKSKEKQGK